MSPYSLYEIIPGSTTIAGTIKKRIPAAANIPFCASLTFGAAIARWVMVWLVPQ